MIDGCSATSASDILRLLAEGTAAALGDEFFRSLAKYSARALGARYAFAAETLNPQESRSLAYWEGSDFGASFSYRFPGTPCQRVAQGHVCSTATGLAAAYPEDLWLQQIGAESYVGVPMQATSGQVLGHLAVLHTTPMSPTPEQIAVLQIFAARGAAELARLQSDRALAQAQKQVELLKERLVAENGYLRDELGGRQHPEEMIGTSAPWRRLSSELEAVASTESTVLIRGETGVGKELVARAIHLRSRRRQRPLVRLNCAAVAPGLIESELFGHVKGAFTGAAQQRIGRFELADQGTLFLDEVGELSLETQARLLRVLQEREFERVGSSESLRVDVRIIAATNRDLELAVQQGSFRADLYYRLNVVPLRVPPLRERSSDVRAGRLRLGHRGPTRCRRAAEGASQHHSQPHEEAGHRARGPGPGVSWRAAAAGASRAAAATARARAPRTPTPGSAPGRAGWRAARGMPRARSPGTRSR
ncbi:MAG TPA: sigma 54-interacting transcriptional regulator [Polyangiaceae bacterium]|nr:sigma 54-interacting transcriptional regulator [Polyangiaceae bacterium]